MKRTPRSELRDVLARNIRLARADRNWSQEKLAFEAGLNRTYVSAVERSEQNMSVDNMARIAIALGVEPFRLLLPSSPKPRDGCFESDGAGNEQAKPSPNG